MTITEDVFGKQVTWTETNRETWRGHTFIEIEPLAEFVDWFGAAGGGRLLVMNDAGEQKEWFGGYTYWVQDVTQAGSGELVVDLWPQRLLRGPASPINPGGELTILFKVDVFGGISLLDLDGDSLPEIVGEDRLSSDLLANAFRVVLPFACKRDGHGLREATATLGRPLIERRISEERGNLVEDGSGGAARNLMALALLLGEAFAAQERAWIESVAGPDIITDLRWLIPDFRKNLAERGPCG